MRFALSKEALKTSLRPRASVTCACGLCEAGTWHTGSSTALHLTCLIWRASFRQWASLSITLGPAIRKKGLEPLSSRKKSDSCDTAVYE